MAQLSFPVTKAGLTVPVWIGLSGETTDALLVAHQQPVLPVQARGLLDIATDVTAVASWVLQQLGVPAISTASTTTAGGPVTVNVYKLSLGITDPGQPILTWLTWPNLLVTELATVLPDADVLIGLDVLLECKLLLDGPARHFTLEF